jgi:hypothetical protein
MDSVKPAEVLAVATYPKGGWPPGALDLIRQIAAQEGYRLIEAKFHKWEEVAELAVYLPKSEVQKFKACLHAKYLRHIFIFQEHH